MFFFCLPFMNKLQLTVGAYVCLSCLVLHAVPAMQPIWCFYLLNGKFTAL